MTTYKVTYIKDGIVGTASYTPAYPNATEVYAQNKAYEDFGSGIEIVKIEVEGSVNEMKISEEIDVKIIEQEVRGKRILVTVKCLDGKVRQVAGFSVDSYEHGKLISSGDINFVTQINGRASNSTDTLNVKTFGKKLQSEMERIVKGLNV